jgi:hypothetical protein
MDYCERYKEMTKESSSNINQERIMGRNGERKYEKQTEPVSCAVRVAVRAVV